MTETTPGPVVRPELFIDLETTGLDPDVHEITEVAVLNIRGDVLIHALVTVEHPERADPDALAINGYDEQLWRSKARPWNEVAFSLTALFCATPHPVLVGHFVDFDRRFLERGFYVAGLDPAIVPIRCVDTHSLAHEHLGDFMASRSLAEIAKILDREPTGQLHRALADTELARKVYLELRQANGIQRMRWRERARALQESPCKM